MSSTTTARGTAAGVRQSSLREQNLAVVCADVFGSEVPPSRADVAAHTGMTRSTVSRLVDDLLGAGILNEQAALSGRRGRPAVPLTPAAGTLVGLGLEVSVDYMAGRVVDLRGEVLAERVVPADLRGSDPAEVLPEIGRIGRDLAGEADAGRLVGTVLAVPGLVDPGTGKLLLAPNLRWRETDPAALLGEALVRKLGGTVTLGNEATLAALSTATAAPGRLREPRTFLYLSGRVGVGAAAVLDGTVMTGRHGWAGEIGHVSVEPDGPECRCGARGCLEQYAGKRALLEAAGLPPSDDVDDLLELVDGDGAGADRARAAVERAGWALGVTIAGAVNLLDVDRIVLGGGLAPLTDRLRPAVVAELEKRVLSSPWAPPSVQAAPRDPTPAALGAALQAVSAVLADPARWVDEAIGTDGQKA